MTSSEFHGANRTLGIPDNWKDSSEARCNPLFIRDGELAGHRTMESVWVLSDNEREAIACGENVLLLIVGSMHPPVALSITDVKILDPQPFK